VLRLQRIAHGRQSARRGGVPTAPGAQTLVEDAPAIQRYHTAADAAARAYPTDPWFADKLADAQLLAAGVGGL
jgi:hypothetical protein